MSEANQAAVTANASATEVQRAADDLRQAAQALTQTVADKKLPSTEQVADQPVGHRCPRRCTPAGDDHPMTPPRNDYGSISISLLAFAGMGGSIRLCA